jgi:hypothetical protein
VLYLGCRADFPEDSSASSAAAQFFDATFAMNSTNCDLTSNVFVSRMREQYGKFIIETDNSKVPTCLPLLAVG